MTEIHRIHLNEHVIPGKRLGRHVEHDPRSRQYPFGAVLAPTALKSVRHKRYGVIFDQDKPKPLGSCTGNACAGAVNTVPLHVIRRTLKEADAVKLYERATVLDGFPGAYPPDDTGSSGLAVAKAAVEAGYITAYSHAFNMAEALTALQIKPVITGVPWYEGFDNPDDNGLVAIAGQIRGGHEFVVRGFEWQGSVDASIVDADNSWGFGYGKDGSFRFTVKTWRTLLADNGDVTILGRT